MTDCCLTWYSSPGQYIDCTAHLHTHDRIWFPTEGCRRNRGITTLIFCKSASKGLWDSGVPTLSVRQKWAPTLKMLLFLLPRQNLQQKHFGDHLAHAHLYPNLAEKNSAWFAQDHRVKFWPLRDSEPLCSPIMQWKGFKARQDYTVCDPVQVT